MEATRILSAQQAAAVKDFTLNYGPITSIIQKRLRSVYGFDDIEVKNNKNAISVRVRRNGQESTLKKVIPPAAQVEQALGQLHQVMVRVQHCLQRRAPHHLLALGGEFAQQGIASRELTGFRGAWRDFRSIGHWKYKISQCTAIAYVYSSVDTGKFDKLLDMSYGDYEKTRNNDDLLFIECVIASAVPLELKSLLDSVK